MSNTTSTPKRTAAGENLASQALSKAVVYFIDGNSRKRYSRDKSKNGLPNRTLGISRLKKMVEGWKDNVQYAIIYDNTTDQEVTRYTSGKWS